MSSAFGARREGSRFVCAICPTGVLSPGNEPSHWNSQRHRGRVAVFSGFELNASNFVCTLCRRQFPVLRSALQHATSHGHRSHLRALQDHALSLNKRDVRITSSEDPIVAPGQAVKIKFETDRDSDGKFRLTDRQGALQEQKNLRFVENGWADIFLEGHAPTAPCVLGVTVRFEFQGFTIQHKKTIRVTSISDEERKALAPTTPYQQQSREPRRRHEGKLIEGERPERAKRPEYKLKLDEYKIPKDLKPDDVLSLVPLEVKNYAERFSKLLHVEEIQMDFDIAQFNRDVRFEADGRFLRLLVHGLAENRPSLVFGDHLLAYPVGSTDVKFKGYVHNVELEHVSLRFHKNFHDNFFPGATFHVEFKFSRVQLRRQHQAVYLLSINDKLLQQRMFPTVPLRSDSFPAPKIAASQLRLFERRIQENAAQLAAVKGILEHCCRPAPYVIFGPPGTGKTTVVIEAVQQIIDRDRTARVLVCTPSNSAADLIVERLPANWTDKMHRMMAYSRDPRQHSEAVKRFCNYKEGDRHFAPSELKQILNQRVVVCTCMTAGVLAAMGVGDDFFTHIVIDEAGHCTEPEAAIAFAGLSHANTCLVLVGDPQQLGPIIRSGTAKKAGLDKSLLERLMERDVYKSQASSESKTVRFDDRYITKLVQNFRSHPSILALPNELFYAGDLVPCADKLERELFTAWPGLPKENKGAFPVVFRSVHGKEEREGDSPSWFNISEAEMVAADVKAVLEYKRAAVDLSQIGIIAPYRKQVAKIRELLKMRYQAASLEKKGVVVGRSSHLVGSVEEFQGQERRVIIISTVRSAFDEVATDIKHHLGFLSNPRRFNVAITRAKALVVVVGDPRVLVHDEHWRAFINFCIAHGSFTGPRPTDNELAGKFETRIDGLDGGDDGSHGSGSSAAPGEHKGEFETRIDGLDGGDDGSHGSGSSAAPGEHKGEFKLSQQGAGAGGGAGSGSGSARFGSGVTGSSVVSVGNSRISLVQSEVEWQDRR